MAVLPGIAGIGGTDYADPTAFDAGFRITIVFAAALLLGAAILAAVGIRSRHAVVGSGDRMRVEERVHCPISGPPPCPDASSVPT